MSLENSNRLISEFENGKGIELQARLEKYSKDRRNWLEEIWLRKAYLEQRDSLVINCSYFMLFNDARMNHSNIQLYRAANLIFNANRYKDLEKETEFAGKTALCMFQYSTIFGTTRIPQKGCDAMFQNRESKHILVLFKDQIFQLGLQNEMTKGDIFTSLKTILDTKVDQPRIAALTSLNRDKWADLYVKIKKNNPENIDIIENALFAVSLDEMNQDVNHNGKQILHGTNRWYDKCLSFVVGNNGRMGLNGEHTPCDAVIPGKLVEYCVDEECPFDESSERSLTVKKLRWNVEPDIEKAIEEAESELMLRGNNLGLFIHHQNIGSNSIKKLKISPDAFIQICLQTTYYKIRNSFANTYETASTRKFFHGRTECARPLSVEAKEFVQSFLSNDSFSIQYAKLVKFSNSHIEQLRMCADGHGVDRHLLGLKSMLKTNEECEFFADPNFAEFFTFRLSTSNMSPADHYIGLGFGPATKDGYGINYCISKEKIRVTISAAPGKPEEFKSVFENVVKKILAMGESVVGNKL